MLAALHDYLAAHHYRDIDAVKTGSDGSKWFFTRDPEGNRVEFYQAAEHPFHAAANLVSPRIIHVGYLVKDRAKEDTLLSRPAWVPAVLVWRHASGQGGLGLGAGAGWA